MEDNSRVYINVKYTHKLFRVTQITLRIQRPTWDRNEGKQRRKITSDRWAILKSISSFYLYLRTFLKRFNYDILWPAKISLSAGSLNAASMQVFSDCPHLLHCTFTFIPGVPPISFTVRLVAIKRSTLFHLENARFLWLLVLRLVFHDAKTPAAAKSAAQFSSTGDESNG